MGETQILLAIHDAIARTGKCLLWRHNSGGHGRLRYGLGVGGADLIGVIKGSGRFLALEVKTATGRMTREQVAWHRAVTDAGGFAACVRSVDEALMALEEAMR